MNIQDVEKQLAEGQKKPKTVFSAGDTVRVYYKIREREKERLMPIEGIILKQQGEGFRKSFTMRRMSYGSSMELTFPLYSPNIEKLEVVKPSKKRARRARLYYLRERVGREAITA